ncbi:MAG: radical SAM protein [Armatimonadetes bacterium]|nr:radical SAM protein [Armatimonadota bacterium]
MRKVEKGERLDVRDGVALFSEDLLTLGRLAELRKNAWHDSKVATFVVDRNISYTNVCTVRCRFCAFYRSPRSPEGYVLSWDEISEKIQALVDGGGTQVLLQGGVNPALSISFYTDLFRRIKSAFPVHIHSLSAPEIDGIARLEKTTVEVVLQALVEAGLDSLPGGGAEILVDRVRNIISPGKIGSDRWLEIHEKAHRLGISTTATMMYGSAHIPPATGMDYLKTLAISRIMLDNIPNIQGGWLTEGEKLGQVSLFFGANDMGGVISEDKVLEPTRIVCTLTPSLMADLIRRAGKTPVQRNTRYERIKTFS